MSKIQSVDVSVFWELVKSAAWASDFNYVRIKIQLMKSLTATAQNEYETIFNKMTGVLAKTIDQYCEENDTTIGCGDDSFSDLVAHIVGLGQAEYDAAIKDPGIAVKRASKGQYKESFAYSVPSALDQESISKDNYMSRAKEYLESEGLAYFIKLPDNKKEALSVLNDVDVEKNVKFIIYKLQEVASGNMEPLDVQNFQNKDFGNDSIKENELFMAWNTVTPALSLHYGVPNLINDYNRYKDLIK
jgi:hypothetical protein